ncbi:uncharacterized protein HD556DRAFT_1507591 [Suillus plorans]|uniref:Uncharacterized protein n=1 Tax=Suillus plorans TaxID=116603 RepID=A0A9P7ADQ4_9AGAM|nr:uncharacterized protein HD556DRAFT_1507591 [Suillus plorans]KAG1786213.1 hypothetical protein HD556DRAFT_1507591 [Suillus plorans]
MGPAYVVVDSCGLPTYVICNSRVGPWVSGWRRILCKDGPIVQQNGHLSRLWGGPVEFRLSAGIADERGTNCQNFGKCSSKSGNGEQIQRDDHKNALHRRHCPANVHYPPGQSNFWHTGRYLDGVSGPQHSSTGAGPLSVGALVRWARIRLWASNGPNGNMKATVVGPHKEIQNSGGSPLNLPEAHMGPMKLLFDPKGFLDQAQGSEKRKYDRKLLKTLTPTGNW